MLGASLAVAVLAGVSGSRPGVNATELLSDPAQSPLINDPSWISIGTIANETAVISTIVLWLWLLKPDRSAVLPLGVPSVLGVLGGLLLVFGLAPLAELAGELTHRLLGNEVTASHIVVNAARRATTTGLVLLLAAVAVLPAVAEEALFRGLLTAPFERRFVAGLLIPSVLFGLFHLEPTQVAGTIVLGVGFAAARLCTGSLVTSMIVHLLYNAAVVLAVRYSDSVAEREIQGAPLLVGFVLASAGALLLWRQRRALLARRAGARPSMPSWWI